MPSHVPPSDINSTLPFVGYVQRAWMSAARVWRGPPTEEPNLQWLTLALD